MTVRSCALLVLCLLGACHRGPPPVPADMQRARDWREKDVVLPKAPARIISLVPSTTELLFAVGAGPQIAGVTSHSDFPPEAAQKPQIGDFSALNLEVVRGLRPDMAVSACLLTERTVAAVEALHVPTFCVDPISLLDIARALRVLGTITGHASEGERAAAEFERRMKAVEVNVASQRRPSVVLELSSDLHVAVPGTYGNDLIERAGGRNAFADLFAPLFAPVTWEAVLERDPDIYVVAHDYPPRPEDRPGFAKLAAVRGKRFVRIDADLFARPTPRVLDGLEALAKVVHP